MTVGNYVVLYLTNEANNTVSIARVIYGGRDIPALLQLRSHLRRRDKRIQLLDTDGSDWRDNRRYRSHHTDYFKHQKKQRPLVSHKLSDHRRIVK